MNLFFNLLDDQYVMNIHKYVTYENRNCLARTQYTMYVTPYRFNTTYFKNFFFVKSIDHWNCVPTNFVDNTNVSAFIDSLVLYV